MNDMTAPVLVTHTPFRLSPMPAPGAPDSPSSSRATVAVDAANSYPCRRCLRDGKPGETMTLMSYNPFLGESPYSAPGPVFVHTTGCVEFSGDHIPEQLRRRLLAVRAYDAGHFMLESDIVDGSDLGSLVGTMFANERVAYAHVHFAKAGCFAVRVDRRPAGRDHT
jgi:hypothetical protein